MSPRKDSGLLRCARNDGGCGISSVSIGVRVRSLTHFPVLAAHRARALLQSQPPENAEGAGKAGCRLAPTVHCAKACAKKAAQRHTGEAQHTAFPAQWFYGLCRALPGERCTIAPVALRMADVADPVGPSHHRKTWRTDPGRQDHTILPYADCTGRVRAAFAHGRSALQTPSRRRCLRPPRPIPRS
jgi:hypothetical protein